MTHSGVAYLVPDVVTVTPKINYTIQIYLQTDSRRSDIQVYLHAFQKIYILWWLNIIIQNSILPTKKDEKESKSKHSNMIKLPYEKILMYKLEFIYLEKVE